jgi:hypothetical protein
MSCLQTRAQDWNKDRIDKTAAAWSWSSLLLYRFPELFFSALIIVAGGAITSCGGRDSGPEPFALIPPDETAFEEAPPLRGPREKLEGPLIIVETPDDNAEFSEPFPIIVRFEPGDPGLDVDMESLGVSVKRFIMVADRTTEARRFLVGKTIKMPAVEAPRGTYTVKIYIEDVGGNASYTRRTVTMK